MSNKRAEVKVLGEHVRFRTRVADKALCVELLRNLHSLLCADVQLPRCQLFEFLQKRQKESQMLTKSWQRNGDIRSQYRLQHVAVV